MVRSAALTLLCNWVLMVHARGSFWIPVLPAAGDRPGLPRLLWVLALLGLFLLPMQVRAGSQQSHPHALLHLILDARDGSVDHHVASRLTEPAHEPHADHDAGHASAQPDIPTFSNSSFAGGGLIVLAVLLMVLALPVPGARPIWSRLAGWVAHLPALEPPPPRYLLPAIVRAPTSCGMRPSRLWCRP